MREQRPVGREFPDLDIQVALPAGRRTEPAQLISHAADRHGRQHVTGLAQQGAHAPERDTKFVQELDVAILENALFVRRHGIQQPRALAIERAVARPQRGPGGHRIPNRASALSRSTLRLAAGRHSIAATSSIARSGSTTGQSVPNSTLSWPNVFM